jgi:hypothetical protein
MDNEARPSNAIDVLDRDPIDRFGAFRHDAVSSNVTKGSRRTSLRTMRRLVRSTCLSMRQLDGAHPARTIDPLSCALAGHDMPSQP